MEQIVYLLLIFVGVSFAAFFLIRALAPSPVARRLEAIGGPEATAAPRKPGSATQQRLARLSEPVARLSAPPEGWDNSALRLRFVNAGYRESSAPVIFFAAKTALAFGFPLLFMLYTGIRNIPLNANVILFNVLMLVASGYYLPNFILARKTKLRQRDLFENFPDAMDLMTVCVEAGLALDMALARAGEEMRLKCPALADEFNLVTLELRAGASRAQALRNLALRTGVDEIATFATMLTQADRFGTNVADSLRVHSDTLRTRRRQRAEEAAAKLPVKLLFPLIFFVFPSLLLVLMGPSMVVIYRVVLPAMAAK